MLHDSRYHVEQQLLETYGTDTIVGLLGVRKYLPRHGHFARRVNVHPFTNIFRRLRPRPKLILVNRDDARRWLPGTPGASLLEALGRNEYGYTLAIDHKTDLKWLTFKVEDYFNTGKSRVYTNLDKINPRIQVFVNETL